MSTLPISYLTKMSSKGVFTTLPRVHSHGAFQIITRSHHESYFDLTCETSSLRYTSIVYPLRPYLSLPLRVDIASVSHLYNKLWSTVCEMCISFMNFHWVVAVCIGNSMICSDIRHKYHVQIMLLFVYTTNCQGFVIFTCRYFKLSWNTTALSQSNWRNFLR